MHQYLRGAGSARQRAGGRSRRLADEPAGERVSRWLASLAPAQLEDLALRLSGDLMQRGLTVNDADAGVIRPIPCLLTPETADSERIAYLSDDSRSLLSAAVKAARHVLSAGTGDAAGHRLFARFTPLEMAFLRRHADALARVATARVDFFEGPEGGPVALEINATIPAMQGYSDILSRSWLEQVALRRGWAADEIAALIERETSNTRELLDSLLAHYRQLGGLVARPAIAIVSRRGDAQIAELRHYERVFSDSGYRALHVYADEIELDAAGRVRARGERFDLVYRHIFARRIDPASPLARLLLEPGPTAVLNPILSPLEAKGLLAVLDTAVEGSAPVTDLVLDEGERDAVTRLLPWTRLLDDGPSRLADGTVVPDLSAWVAQHPERVVLKRNWDYGGRSVILGPSHAASETRRRAQRVLGVASWSEVVAHASRDVDAWVVQAYVEPPRRRQCLLERDGSGAISTHWRDVFSDIGAYSNLGVAAQPRGAASRYSATPIVNILSGGGMVPLISRAALEALFPPAAEGAP